MNGCSLKNWLVYLESLPSGLNSPDLERTRKIAQSLNLFPITTKVITVTGTNGKGSCVAFLEAILLAAGFKVGAYTSPHVLHYNERIRINGSNVSDSDLVPAFAAVAEAKKDVVLSFFEFTTLAALLLFKNSPLDVLILEVGVGGRLDPVNIVDPDIAVITTVALDHTQILGSSREAIATEKSGIMRPLKDVVCGDLCPPANIFKIAQLLSARLHLLNREYNYESSDEVWTWKSGELSLNNLPVPKLPMQNAATALMVIKLLQQSLSIPNGAIEQGLLTATLLGRYQKLSLENKVEIILDVAHNPEAALLLAKKLNKEIIAGRVLAVMSMFQDKDIMATLQPLIPLVDCWYIGKLHNSRAAEVEALSSSLQKLASSEEIFPDETSQLSANPKDQSKRINVNYANKIKKFPTIDVAMQQAIAESVEIDRIITFGSFHVVAEVLESFAKNVRVLS